MKQGIISLAIVVLMVSTSNALAVEPGELVLGQWEAGIWYPARVAEVTGEDVLVSFYDGDVAVLPMSAIKPFDWEVGTEVECNWRRLGRYHKATISQIKVEWMQIQYNRGDQEDTGIGRCRVRQL